MNYKVKKQKEEYKKNVSILQEEAVTSDYIKVRLLLKASHIIKLI